MSLSFFYAADLNGDTLVLDEEMSKHIVQVLRMGEGDALVLTDGKGRKREAVISDAARKRCAVRFLNEERQQPYHPRVTVAISLIKNTARFEWFLEKAAEIGVSAIIPLLCERTEREKFRQDRLQSILVSAMLQSQQAWLPQLYEPAPFTQVIGQYDGSRQKFIAHCLPEQKTSLAGALGAQRERVILIGPEGDFTEKEIRLALEKGFEAVSLGATRLRTETAGIVAAALLCRDR